jgi:hypothetical protein
MVGKLLEVDIGKTNVARTICHLNMVTRQICLLSKERNPVFFFLSI